jgi:hypothetical protein
MSELKAYLLRLILCGFLVSLAGALINGKRGARAVTLCGGCLLILTAVQPLMRVDLSRLPDLVTGLMRSEREAEAKEKNEALLRSIIEEQTAAWIVEQAEERGAALEAVVTTAEAGEGVYIPYAVMIRGVWTEAQRDAISRLIVEELDIPPEHQRWADG